MTTAILTPQPIRNKNFRRFRIYRLSRHRPRQRSAEECIQIWERNARRRQYIRPKKRDNQAATSRLKGEAVEALLAAWLKSQGYQVELTPSNENYDLVIAGVLNIEVKFSTWNLQVDSRGRRSRFRYQFRIHPRQVERADLFILVARSGEDHCFIIPSQALAQQRSVTVRSFDPAEYKGKWARYLAAWDLLDEALGQKGGRA
jgi:hypothetical protein